MTTYEIYKEFLENNVGKYIKSETIPLIQQINYIVFYNENLRKVKKIIEKYDDIQFKINRYRENYWELEYLVEYFINDIDLNSKYENLSIELEDVKWFGGTGSNFEGFETKIKEIDYIEYYLFNPKFDNNVNDIIESLDWEILARKQFEFESNELGIDKLNLIKIKDKVPSQGLYNLGESIFKQIQNFFKKSKMDYYKYYDKNGKIDLAIHKYSEDDNRKSIVGFRKELKEVFLSSWEANLARVLNYLNIKWEYEKESFDITSDFSKGSYLPDFFIGNNMIIEVKGYWDYKSLLKVNVFKEKYPNYNLLLIDGDMFYSLDKIYRNKLPNWELNNQIITLEKIPVVGVARPERKRYVSQIQVGDELFLNRDKENKFDKNAIEVLNKDNKLIGYVGKDWACIYADKFDLGMKFSAIVSDIEPKVITIDVKRTNLDEDIVYDILKPI